jgi:ATP-dependent Clp protease ATP-binding subunit ClpB
MDLAAVPGGWVFFSRCTMEARRAVSYARQAVADLGGSSLSAEHLLCGLLNADVVASRYLVALPTTAAELRGQLEGLLARVPSANTSIDVPLDDEAKQVLNRAWGVAESMGHKKVSSDHLLLGLLGGDSAAATLLKANGMADAAIRRAIPDHDPDDDEK